MTSDRDTGVVIIGCIGIIPAIILSYVLRGWAIVTLWIWFVTPVFHVQAPNGAIAIGLGVVGGILAGTSDIDTSSNKSTENQSALSIMLSAYVKVLLKAPMAVAFGWVVRHWV